MVRIRQVEYTGRYSTEPCRTVDTVIRSHENQRHVDETDESFNKETSSTLRDRAYLGYSHLFVILLSVLFLTARLLCCQPFLTAAYVVGIKL